MKFLYDIPSSFWGLFRSVNRDIYMEALLAINEEYQYNNYFLSREACIQVLSEMCASRRFQYETEEIETEEEKLETLPRRILNWLVNTSWLRKIEDYTTMATNIVIPDYSAVFIEALEHLVNQPFDETELYIQNVYASLFSFQNDSRMNMTMLKTALVNTKKLNKALQDMLHNMDKFFERLLEKKSYDELLKEHLEGYVEEVVKRKYHILKTSDNFYIYKMDIKRCLKEMREDEAWVTRIRTKQRLERAGKNGISPAPTASGEARTPEDLPFRYGRKQQEEDVLDLIDQIERGFDDIEHRIANMDREHSKYIRATVSRLNYLLSDETKRHGLLIQLLNKLGGQEDVKEQRIAMTAEHMKLASLEILSENPLFKRRRRKSFTEDLLEDEETAELTQEDVLRLNRLKHRFTRKQIEDFIGQQMVDGVLMSEQMQITSDEDFEKLILAYDFCIRNNSKYEVLAKEHQVKHGPYSYPVMIFRKRTEA